MEPDESLIVVQDVGTVLVDELVDAIAKSVPGINVVWNISKALYGVGLKLRQQKALEWVEMIQSNPGVFTQEVFADPQFQDAFVYSLERYLRFRNEEKRQDFKNIFLNFAKSQFKDEFELEKCISTLDQLLEADITTLRDIDLKRTDSNYQLYGATDKNIDSIFTLIHAGILIQDITPRFAGEAGSYAAPFVKISPFGKRFIEYISA